MIDSKKELGNATERVRKLRERTLNLEPRTAYRETTLLHSRAWKESTVKWDLSANAVSLVYRRAVVFSTILKGLTPQINEGELLVGKACRRKLTEEECQEVDIWLHQTSKLIPQIDGMSSHMSIDFSKVVQLGCSGVRKQIERKMAGLKLTEAAHLDKIAFYEACLVSLDGLETMSNNYADHAEKLAVEEKNAERKAELLEIARICRKVPAQPAETFYEAVQSMHFVNAVFTFLHGLYQLGRPDRYLYPFYKRDIENGTLTREKAQEIWDCECILLNELVPRGLAIGYMVGGRDANGNDVSNELSEIMIESVRHTRLVYPGVGLCQHPGSPKHLLKQTAEILAEGASHPAIYNDITITQGLIDLGLPPADACEYIHSTCVEITPCSCSNVWVASPYINLVTPLHDAIGLGQDKSPTYASFDDLLAKVKQNLEAMVEAESNKISLMRLGRYQQGGFALLSCFVNDCISKGKDIDHGGARYDWNEMSFVGLANLADSLASIQQFVFEEKSLTLDSLCKALETNYEDQEELRLKILNRAPKYGNADERVDQLAKVATEWAHAACSRNRIHPDSEVVAGFFCWVMHEYLGRQTPASPDGRLCGFPLGDGSGPAQGRERKGPTSAVLSTTSWDHTPMLGGIALNLKFTPGRNRGKFVDSLVSLIETYCDRGGFEVQVNVVDNETLKKAQQHPEEYRDLVVRIGGYSDYFVGLSPEMQSEVIARFEHTIA